MHAQSWCTFSKLIVYLNFEVKLFLVLQKASKTQLQDYKMCICHKLNCFKVQRFSLHVTIIWSFNSIPLGTKFIEIWFLSEHGDKLINISFECKQQRVTLICFVSQGHLIVVLCHLWQNIKLSLKWILYIRLI